MKKELAPGIYSGTPEAYAWALAGIEQDVAGAKARAAARAEAAEANDKDYPGH